jgi:hypothetical protein
MREWGQLRANFAGFAEKTDPCDGSQSNRRAARPGALWLAAMLLRGSPFNSLLEGRLCSADVDTRRFERLDLEIGIISIPNVKRDLTTHPQESVPRIAGHAERCD